MVLVCCFSKTKLRRSKCIKIPFTTVNNNTLFCVSIYHTLIVIKILNSKDVPRNYKSVNSKSRLAFFLVFNEDHKLI